MNKFKGLNLVVPPDYLNATAVVSLLSVLVLICLFCYLNCYTGRRYFSLWTVGWLFYAVWLGIGPGVANIGPFEVMLKHWCVGVSAALFFWGSVQFLKLPSRPVLFWLFTGFLLVWSYVGAYHLRDPLEIRAPIFGVIALASFVMAFSFYRLRKHREYLGAGLLTFGFVLWGFYLGVYPFFAGNAALAGTGLLISAALQLHIAVSMIILVLEEARAASEMILNRIRAYDSEAQGRPAGRAPEEAEYHGLFDGASLSARLNTACVDLRLAQEKGLRQERLQALGQMSRGVAHDINNALTPVLGYADLLLRESRGLPEGVLEYIRGIKNGGEKISRSVACIRDFYRKRDGKDVFVATELNPLVLEIVESSRSQWPSSPLKGAQVEFWFEPDPASPRAMGNQTEIRDALIQLVQNAAQAMPEGGAVRLRTGIRRATQTGDDGGAVERVFAEVRDEGIGMDEATRKRCLEPFFSTKGRPGARGIGLSKVFGIMQHHQGQIEIESEPGKGTVMRLVFPAAAAESAGAGASLSGARILKILCIDDEPAILDVLRIVLTSEGHKVEVALNGQKGLELFRAAQAASEPFAVVLTDLGMPDLDGHQVAKLIKQESPKTPVIMLTGWGGIMQVEGNQPEHVDLILSKPPQVSELLGALHKVLPG